MATLESAESTAKGLRQVIQDLIVSELREVKADLRGVNERLDRMDTRFERLDGRMDRMDDRFDRMDGRLDKLQQTVAEGFENMRRQFEVYQDVQSLRERVIRIELERGPKPAASK